MLENGDDPAKVTDAVFNRAIDRIKKAVDSGQIRKFTATTTRRLSRKETRGGDVVVRRHRQISATRRSTGNIPTQGGIIWTDNMLIPLGGNVYTASAYMNFVYDPEDRRAVGRRGNYISSGEGRQAGRDEARSQGGEEHR